ncbi:hypothetical protein [Burkholderia sp. MSMB1078WGS]|uniref:hypothetical protein n=1 Tax=Burkholderia sp. MSMB1078WGS TaxID=1637900 RepID=UPI0012E3C749|nr:hypothetical protein [Burkholderia sp. MSMB1078WGS]
MSVVNRFTSLLEFVIERYDHNDLIGFGASNDVPVVADAGSGPGGQRTVALTGHYELKPQPTDGFCIIGR